MARVTRIAIVLPLMFVLVSIAVSMPRADSAPRVPQQRNAFYLGEPCEEPNRKCLPKRSQCTNNRCQCKPNYASAGANHCKAQPGTVVRTSECSNDTDCSNHLNAQCVLSPGSQDGFCSCRYGEISPSSCRASNDNVDCVTSDDCTGGQECMPLPTEAESSSMTCRCLLQTDILHNGTCANPSNPLSCNSATPCPVLADGGYSYCQEGGTCQCLQSTNNVPGKYVNVAGNVTCQGKGNADRCSAASECPTADGLTCYNGFCSCLPYHRPNTTRPGGPPSLPTGCPIACTPCLPPTFLLTVPPGTPCLACIACCLLMQPTYPWPLPLLACLLHPLPALLCSLAPTSCIIHL
ncbi:integrin beta-6-like [Paramacrobiotus metropolitanus]|uniref:integrin beta-6-like n=1 Tax=Paramacrobiotus metropolitanus TaxID=2943436 RepID=UPI0024460AF1|nr:integrin beta-6-like [Paramacrobiotus metropolitanus]